MATKKKSTKTNKAKKLNHPVRLSKLKSIFDHGFNTDSSVTAQHAKQLKEQYEKGFAAGHKEAESHDKPSLNFEYIKDNESWEITPGAKAQLEKFPTGAIRRKTPECRLDLIPLEALEGYGDRLHYGASVRGYGDRNWEKGIPYSNLLQHAQTHLSKLMSQMISNQLEGVEDLHQNRVQVINEKDSIYGNACALLWNAAAIITFLRRGNPAEKK